LSLEDFRREVASDKQEFLKIVQKSALRVLADTNTSIALYKSTSKSRLIYASIQGARWRTHWVITKRNDLPTTLCTTLDSVNPVLYPSIDTMLIKLCVLLTMPEEM
jgi:hypothetical protein